MNEVQSNKDLEKGLRIAIRMGRFCYPKIPKPILLFQTWVGLNIQKANVSVLEFVNQRTDGEFDDLLDIQKDILDVLENIRSLARLGVSYDHAQRVLFSRHFPHLYPMIDRLLNE